MEDKPDERASSLLATPGGVLSGENDFESLKNTSRAFNFPYPAAYHIQIDLMQSVFRAIEDGKVGLFESPTGTGKSLSLICAAFTWLKLDAERRLNSQMEVDVGKDPDWVVAHELKKKREEHISHEETLQEKIQNARNKLIASKGAQSSMNKRSKLQKSTRESDEESDSAFLIREGETGSFGSSEPIDDSMYLSPAVRELMEQMNPAASGEMKVKPFYARKGRPDDGEEGDEEPETKPKIIYASRTHTQLSQFIFELKKTDFGKDIEVTSIGETAYKTEPTRNISLGSRKQMCINSTVQDVGKRVGMEAMNERCVELMKGSATKSIKSEKGAKCRYLPPPDETGQSQLLDFRDSAFTKVRDIEELVGLGREMHICPYFGARSSARQAQLVTLPYNLLLQSSARASLNIDLKDSIIVIDEAHNLIDTILSIHTVMVSSNQMKQAQGQIHEYLKRFSSKLKGINEVNLKKFLKFLESLDVECNNQKKKFQSSKTVEEIISGADLMRRLGGNLDQVNLVELERWLKDTQIARKVAGYAEKQKAKLIEGRNSTTTLNQSALSAMHTLEAFLLSLANQSDDGRVLLSYNKDVVASSEDDHVTLKYQLLNPSDVFKDVVSLARSVILAGGTMEPISDFTNQLFPTLEKNRLVHFSCNHVIPPENLMATVVSKGPKGKDLEFKFDARSDPALLDELTNCIVNYCNVIPNGIVVFLPSYSFLDSLSARWKTSNGSQRIGAKKSIFYEPKLASEVEFVLRNYSLAASSTSGGILFAVVGAKLSEGINFSDRLARAVIMVGMPFANSASAELAERMNYVRSLATSKNSKTDPGQELYVNLCMKAVNQSIGRAIRHQADYAALILLDRRYGRQDIRNRLPAWIRPSVKTYDTFGPSVAALGTFFREKRGKDTS